MKCALNHACGYPRSVLNEKVQLAHAHSLYKRCPRGVMSSFEPGEVIVLSSGEESDNSDKISSPVSKVLKIERHSHLSTEKRLTNGRLSMAQTVA